MGVRFFSFLSLIAILAVARLIPHPPNFSPMLALALFAGAKAPKKWLGYVSALAALWLSDWLIGTHDLMLITGLSMLMAVAIGSFTESQVEDFSSSKKAFGWLGAGLVASILFFLVTNFFVWQTSGMYPMTGEGLWTCYVMALPFFHNQVLATWMFSAAAFSAYQVVIAGQAAARTQL